MSRLSVTALMLVSLITCAGGLFAEEATLSLWAVDPLIKVFPDMAAAESAKKVEMRGGRNEYFSGQVAVRAEQELRGLLARWDPLRHTEGGYTFPSESLRWRFAGIPPKAIFCVPRPARFPIRCWRRNRWTCLRGAPSQSG
ncbi:hypothetical protein HQ563_18025 [bacterium]|nr:hypothetical protein [bacterium]